MVPHGGIHQSTRVTVFHGAMGGVALAPRQLIGEIGWHLGAVTPVVAASYANGGLPIIVSDAGGAESARRLRAGGYDGELLVDPRRYERSDPTTDGQLFELRVDWEALQRRAGATALLSPGKYVPPGDAVTLAAAVDAEAEWVSTRPGATIQIAVHWRWLIGADRRELARRLQGVGRAALLLADSNDPLSKVGAVEGLAELVVENQNLGVHRCDLGAMGVVALGGGPSFIGINASLRHVVPPGKNAGGIPNDRSTPVFDRRTMYWLKGSKLRGTGTKSPTCDLDSCGGQPLSRFDTPEMNAAAVEHNRHAVEATVRELLQTSPEARFDVFRTMCVEAEVAAAELQLALRQEIAISPQRAAWAQLWR